MLDPDRLEPNPRKEPSYESVALFHAVDGLVHLPVNKSEVAGVLRDAVLRELPEQHVEHPRVQSSDWAGTATGSNDSVDVLVAFFPLLDEFRDHLRRVLQIGGHNDRGVT